LEAPKTGERPHHRGEKKAIPGSKKTKPSRLLEVEGEEERGGYLTQE